MTRGPYYGYAVAPAPHRPEIRRASQVAWQVKSRAEAMDAVEASGSPTGYVQKWVAAENRRMTVVDYDRRTGWSVFDPFTGERVEVTR